MVFFDQESLQNLQTSIEKRLSPSRMAHTIRVKEMAVEIGNLLLPDDVSELAAAALLHDIAKEEKLEKLLHLSSESVKIKSEVELAQFSPVLHGYAAVPIIRSEYPMFATEKILDAVRYHTTGCANMSVFSAIVFLADFIERGRTYSSCVRAREYYFKSIDVPSSARLRGFYETVLFVLKETVVYLEKQSLPVHPDTYEALSYYEQML